MKDFSTQENGTQNVKVEQQEQVSGNNWTLFALLYAYTEHLNILAWLEFAICVPYTQFTSHKELAMNIQREKPLTWLPQFFLFLAWLEDFNDQDFLPGG